jgi:hypothetical protein
VSVASFIEVEQCQVQRTGENIAGDVFLSRKVENGNRVISVLADGLGSGVEACVLASLTAQMALEYLAGNIATRRAAEIVMDALPICPQRKISYSAFTIVDTHIQGATRILEHGNPPFLWIRDGECLPVRQILAREPRWNGRGLTYSEFEVARGDRLIFFSDGISQSGIGTPTYPLGWGIGAVREYVLHVIRKSPDISARNLSQLLVQEALWNDGDGAGDDITCAVIYHRQPRKLLVLTGPPYNKAQDTEYARLIEQYPGRTAICGGTTSDIVARELHRAVHMDLTEIDPEVPTTSTMKGVDLVTEGCLTLGKTAELLGSGVSPDRRNGATRLVDLLLQSDSIEFVVGTCVNAAHQNPSLPVELDIRRNVIKRIKHLLEEKHLKEVQVRYL